MKKKKPAAKKATMAKKPATKPAAAPAKKPGAAKKPVVAQKAAAKPAKKVAPSPAPAATGAPRNQTYTPQPIESTGWAPFRYPPQ
jgi:hypothetical protein